ncbi:MAG TPA: DUF1223 domain-containing protein [Geminicoccaceae bacterium]
MNAILVRLASAAVLLALTTAPAGAGERPVVVELFTSEGCSSCPPADRVLAELVERDGLLPLSFHVTYWDRLGWPDSLGLEDASERQRRYASAMGRGRVYTPQMVIEGRAELVGSRRGAVHEVIALLQERLRPGPVLAVEGARLKVGAGAGPGILWLLAFDHRHDVRIQRGENAGRTITYRNVVRSLRQLARWDGEPLEVALPLAELEAAGRDALAVLLQVPDEGPILGAVRLDLGRPADQSVSSAIDSSSSPK